MFKFYIIWNDTQFYAFVFRRQKQAQQKECIDVFGICSHAYFYLDF